MVSKSAQLVERLLTVGEAATLLGTSERSRVGLSPNGASASCG